MSNFMLTIFCPVCDAKREHYARDDTPTQHRYTVTCRACGNDTMSDVIYADTIKREEADGGK